MLQQHRAFARAQRQVDQDIGQRFDNYSNLGAIPFEYCHVPFGEFMKLT